MISAAWRLSTSPRSAGSLRAAKAPQVSEDAGDEWFAGWYITDDPAPPGIRTHGPARRGSGPGEQPLGMVVAELPLETLALTGSDSVTRDNEVHDSQQLIHVLPRQVQSRRRAARRRTSWRRTGRGRIDSGPRLCRVRCRTQPSRAPLGSLGVTGRGNR